MTPFRLRHAIAGLAVGGLLAAAAASAVQAQDPAANYPNRPIRMVVGFAAGGGNDLFARLVGQKLGENIGQNVIVENKPGAGGRITIRPHRHPVPAAVKGHRSRVTPD